MRRTTSPSVVAPLAALLAMSALLLPGTAHAKDLSGRVGVGFLHSFGDQSALSVRYTLPLGDPAVIVQLEGFGGFAANTDSSGWLIAGGRGLYGLVVEDNMNLYVAAGAGLLTDQVTRQQAVRIQPTMSAEFFLFGLENLGFTTEWGLNLDLGDATGVSTTATAGVGVHYWF